MTGAIADGLFRTYGIPHVYWDKNIGLGRLGSVGKRLSDYVQNGEMDDLLETRRGLHFHGPGSLRHPVLPLFCRGLIITGHKAYYLQADEVATGTPEDPPEEFVRKHIDAVVMCVDNISDSKNSPFPWNEESHYRFEARLLQWIKQDGVLITCGDQTLADTPVREHVVRRLCEHTLLDMDLSEL